MSFWLKSVQYTRTLRKYNQCLFRKVVRLLGFGRHALKSNRICNAKIWFDSPSKHPYPQWRRGAPFQPSILYNPWCASSATGRPRPSFRIDMGWLPLSSRYSWSEFVLQIVCQLARCGQDNWLREWIEKGTLQPRSKQPCASTWVATSICRSKAMML